MCGIFAWWGKDKDNIQTLSPKAVAALDHRGPDSQNLWLSEDGCVALGHTRLGITGHKGTQPLWSADGRIAVLVNGEFYDFWALRQKCTEQGYVFQTDTDSELLIPLYLKYGHKALDYLHGEFAFVLWDREKDLIWTVRDAAGVKPLKYSNGKDGLMFASEIPALQMAGIQIKWDEVALKEALSLQYPRPDRTLYSGIEQLEPGESVFWKPQIGINQSWEKINSCRYWNWFSRPTVYRENVNEVVEQALTQAINRRLETSWPVAVHLSGGIDSSCILALTRASGHRVTAFGVGFENVGTLVEHDESLLAEQTAKILGVDFVRVDGSGGDLVGDWIKAVQHSRSIGINGHLVAKWRLNQAIQKEGFRVALTGEGSDEALLGYPFFKMDGVQSGLWTQSQSQIMNTNVVSQGLMLPDEDGAIDLLDLQKAWGQIPTWVQAKATLGFKLRSLLSDDFKIDKDWLLKWCEDPLDKNPMNQRNFLQGAAASWANRAMGGYILPTLGDAMEGAFGIEGRTPFLDRDFLDLACSLDPLQTRRLRRGAWEEKAPLRALLEKHQLFHIAHRQKHPFQAPPLWSQLSVRKELIERWSDHSFQRRLPFISTSKVQSLMALLNDASLATQQRFEPVVAFLLSLDALSFTMDKHYDS